MPGLFSQSCTDSASSTFSSVLFLVAFHYILCSLVVVSLVILVFAPYFSSPDDEREEVERVSPYELEPAALRAARF